jgi:hypothetical protein
MEFLARSGGRRRGDRIELIPLAEPDVSGTVDQLCLVHGVRYFERAEEVLRELRPGDAVEIALDPTNRVNPMALQVRRHYSFGYVPDPLVDLVSSLTERSAMVEHVNGPEAGHHLRCLIRVQGRLT